MANKYYIDKISDKTDKLYATTMNEKSTAFSKANNYYILNLLGTIRKDILEGHDPVTHTTDENISKYLKNGIPFTNVDKLNYNLQQLPEKVKAIVELVKDKENQKTFMESFFMTEVLDRLLNVEWNEKSGLNTLLNQLVHFGKNHKKPLGLNFVYLIDAIVKKDNNGQYQLVKNPSEQEKVEITKAVDQYIQLLGGKENPIEDEDENTD